MMDKRQIRAEAIRQRQGIPADKAEALSEGVRRNVEALPEYSRARVIASYVAKDREAGTRRLIEGALAGRKTVLVPKSHKETADLTFHALSSLSELRTGEFGVLEPPEGSEAVALDRADLVLVPVVAWDYGGGRLGYGKGYFDRGLKKKGKAVSVGLAFESQRRDALPQGPMDVQLDMIVTEERVIRFGRTSFA